MKFALLTFSSLFAVYVLSQEPDPNLFRTWYLVEVLAHDGFENSLRVEDVSPLISPTLTINEDLSFSGMGACNSFNGNFIYNPIPNNNELQTNVFASTDLACPYESWTEIEEQYFTFFNSSGIPGESIWYFIYEEGENFRLLLNNSIFGFAIFGDSPLAVSESEKFNKEIHAFFDSKQKLLTVILPKNQANNNTISLYEISGKRVFTEKIKSHKTTISLPHLSKGIYIVVIETPLNKFTKKITVSAQ